MLSSVLRGSKRSSRNSYARDTPSTSYGTSAKPNKSTKNARIEKSNHKTGPGRLVGLGGKLKGLCIWCVGLGLGCVLLLGLGVGGLQLHRVATTSDFFSIRRVEIRGATHFTREKILEAAHLQPGTNSLTVNIADVEQGIRNSQWVSEVAVKRRLPDAFEIRIRERIPSFWMLRDDILHYADNKGQVIAPVNVGNFLSLPTLEILPGGEELLSQLDELSRAFQAAKLPVDMAGVSLFRVSAAKGFEVFIENRNLVLCIAAEDWDMNLRRLGVVLADLARRGELKQAREVWAADGNVWVVAPENV